MRTVRPLVLLLSLSALSAWPLSATSYVPMTDSTLVDQAPMIAVVKVQDSDPGPENVYTHTAYRVRLERVLKGTLKSGAEVTVLVPGGPSTDGPILQIWGAPRFARGERALLFLYPNSYGSYSIAHLMLGAFHEVRSAGYRLALRQLAEAHLVSRPGQPLPQEPLRDFRRFVSWVANRAQGRQLLPDYQVTAGASRRQITDPFKLLEGDGYHQRWFEFDNDDDVEWLANQSGQSGLTGGGFAEFQTAIAAWNDDPGTNIRYTYGGTTDNTNGFTHYDGVNVILFGDPNQEVPSFSCPGGGVLAIGGTWFGSPPLPFQEILFTRISGADIITNNGISCFFQDNPQASQAAEELFAHELGHTLGLAHSDVPDALMYPYIHNDGRGALLNADDQAAIASLYRPAPWLPSPTDFFTLPLCRLVDTRGSGQNGMPALHAGQPREFVASGQCGIPSTAVSLSVNITVVAPTGNGHLVLFPADRLQPGTSSLNFSTGLTLANNAILLLSGTSTQSFMADPALGNNGTVDLVVDVNGYFQ